MTQPTTASTPSPLAAAAAVLDGPAPYTTVYLDTSSDVPDAARRVDTRWRNARRELAAAGVDNAVLDAMAAVVDGAHPRGDTLVMVADASSLRSVHHLPAAPPADVHTTRGARPHLVPLVRHEQNQVPVVAVATDRVGAEIVALLPHAEDVEATVSGEDAYVRRSAPGGWSQRRFQQRAEDTWEENAALVAGSLTRLVDATAPRAVVVSGDVRAVQFLREKSASRVAELIREVQGEHASADDVVEQAQQVALGIAAEDVEAALRELAEEHGQGDRVAAGDHDVVTALGQAQVATLVLSDDPEVLERPVWVGPEAAQVATSREALAALGCDDQVEAPLGDAAVAAALATGARVLLVRSELAEARSGEGLADGLAATLRWPQ